MVGLEITKTPGLLVCIETVQSCRAEYKERRRDGKDELDRCHAQMERAKVRLQSIATEEGGIGTQQAARKYVPVGKPHLESDQGMRT